MDPKAAIHSAEQIADDGGGEICKWFQGAAS